MGVPIEKDFTMSKPLWQPTQTHIENSNLWKFIAYINAHHKLKLAHYQQLHTWSIANPEDFWIAVWNFCHVKASHLWEHTLQQQNGQMFGAKWFTEASLNFAENLLSRHDDKIALIFQNEKGQRRSLTYAELYTAVAKLAQALKNLGVQKSDRVVGYLPNIPEAVIAMLATTSIGAIWSSCSPDFGTSAVIDRFSQIEPKILLTIDGHFYNGKSHNELEKVQTIIQSLPNLAKVIVIPYLNETPEINSITNSILYTDLVATIHADKIHFEQVSFNHPVYILYSSGTTGVPKCIVHGAGGTLLQHLKELILHTDLTAHDTMFYYTTTSWMMWHWMISSLAVGATVVLYDGSPLFPNATALFDLIDQEKVTVFGTSAKYITAVEKAEVQPNKTHGLYTLRTILSTGSPLLPENFDYVYKHVKHTVQLSSISGGTDIISCFALGNPMLPVYRGELQSIGLGMKVEVYNEAGEPVLEEKGELVCSSPFPSMPVFFWNDHNQQKYHHAYFEKFPKVWTHGDYAEITGHNGVIIYGRSDATLNPGGIRIGTAEIYQIVENFPEIAESIVVGQEWNNDIRIILFVKLKPEINLTAALKDEIKLAIRNNASPHHVPTKIIQVKDIPRTINNKIVELAVRETIHNRPIKNMDAIANPEALEFFKNLSEIKN